jgi:hypothetical protein
MDGGAPGSFGKTMIFWQLGTTATAVRAASAIGSSGVPSKQNRAFASLSLR